MEVSSFFVDSVDLLQHEQFFLNGKEGNSFRDHLVEIEALVNQEQKRGCVAREIRLALNNTEHFVACSLLGLISYHFLTDFI